MSNLDKKEAAHKRLAEALAGSGRVYVMGKFRLLGDGRAAIEDPVLVELHPGLTLVPKEAKCSNQ